LRASYRQGQQRFLQLASTGATMDATELLMTSLRQDQDKYIARLKSYISVGTMMMERSGQEAADQYHGKTLIMLAIAALAVLLGGGFAWWTTRSITRPVHHAVEVAQQVADGNLCSEIRAGAPDEIGQLLEALRQMNGVSPASWPMCAAGPRPSPPPRPRLPAATWTSRRAPNSRPAHWKKRRRRWKN
jgi:methyl-accepting chemotaxis protein